MIYRAMFVTIAMVGGLVAYGVYDSMRWQEFSEIHECAQTSKTDSYTIMQSSYNLTTKQWTMSPVRYPGHTVYKCNDGKEYTR